MMKIKLLIWIGYAIAVVLALAFVPQRWHLTVGATLGMLLAGVLRLAERGITEDGERRMEEGKE